MPIHRTRAQPNGLLPVPRILTPNSIPARPKQRQTGLRLSGDTKSLVLSAAVHLLLLIAMVFFVGKSPRSGRGFSELKFAEGDSEPLVLNTLGEMSVEDRFDETPQANESDLSSSAFANLDTQIQAFHPEAKPSGNVVMRASDMVDREVGPGSSKPAGFVVLSTPVTAGRTGQKKAQLLKQYGGSAETEAAVARGLAWLVKQQQSDGSWSFAGPYSNPAMFQDNPVSATAMALIAFQGSGNTHLSGQYQEVVARGLKWLCLQQARDGSLGGDTPRHHGFYTHAQANIALCEAYGMSQEAWLRPHAEKATRYTLNAQGPLGGWRYEYKGDSDTSVTGWCLMALVSARSASIEVPDTAFKRIQAFLNSVSLDNGSTYSYVRGRLPTPSMTAEALLCRMYLGWPRETKALNLGIKGLSTNFPFNGTTGSYYYWYYGTQVMHHAGGKDWENWNEAMKPQLMAMQVANGDDMGSWGPAGARFDSIAGRLYSTCMALYCLEIYYRHLPIYDTPWRE
ncbi:MAG: terpene cyclase/mutase family protein [Planctomycetota bacterium]|nr:terpene cyclase/mutase family protein [Planctomycetota bacterium]